MENTNSETNSTIDRAADYAREAADRVSDMGERVADNVRQMGRNVQSRMDEMEIDETTVPDAFRNVPKLISPRVHAWLDVAVSTYFLGLGVLFAIRGKGRAAAAAFVNGTMVAGVSMLTDYDGDGKKPISFKMHGTMDAVQMTMAGLGPVMHGFAGEPEAKYFYGQAANELAVISTTDWDAGMPAAIAAARSLIKLHGARVAPRFACEAWGFRCARHSQIASLHFQGRRLLLLNMRCRKFIQLLVADNSFPLGFSPYVHDSNGPERNQVHTRHELGEERRQKFPVPSQEIG